MFVTKNINNPGFVDKISKFNHICSPNTMKNRWGGRGGEGEGKEEEKEGGKGKKKREEKEEEGGGSGRKKNRLFPIIIYH